jgi:uncharacterized protein YneR
MVNFILSFFDQYHFFSYESLPLRKGWCNNMIISIDERAATWFTSEFEFNKPFSIRMFPQYAGFGQKHKGYSMAFSAETPANIGFTKEINGITFFVEGSDVWFFEDTETYLSFDNRLNEIQVTYKEDIDTKFN